MKRCGKCDQYFKTHECACPHCGAKACPTSAAMKAAVAGAAAAAALLGGANCGQIRPQPLYGVPIMEDGGNKDGG